MQVLVTGGAGFIGSHLVDALVEKGHKVFVIDDLSSGSVENLPQGITLFHRSITENLDEVFERAQPEVVFHLAAQIDVRVSTRNPARDAEINIMGSLNLLDACVKHKCSRIIFSSTGGALYGETNKLPTPENHPVFPESPYGIAKRTVEDYLRFYSRIKGLSTCALRYANVYGPRQALKGEAGVVAIFTKRLLKEEACNIYGDGEQTRDYVYVGDVVKANLAALEHDLSGEYNVGTGVETSVNELYQHIAKILEYPWAAKYAPENPGELLRSSLSHKKISPYWQPEVNLQEGLAVTVKWFTEFAKKT